MELTNILSFLFASMVLTIMPGPDNIYVLAESITRGARTGILISVGLISGIIVHTALAATGISIVIQQSETLFSIIKYFGAAYLLYLAYMATQEKQLSIPSSNNQGSRKEGFALIRQGFFMNVLNPKVSLFFLALLPQFISSEGWPIHLQMVVLGGIFMIQGILIFCIIAVAAGSLNQLVAKSNFWVIMKWTKVIILLTLSVMLFIVEH